ncbi:MAG: Homoserine kinase [Firmicutes bacterium]|nr:Homoserine kinase [Bacillota bacterium]
MLGVNTVRVRVPGTTANCGPGFDSIGIACDIYNELEVTLLKKDTITIEIVGEGKNSIPCDKRNVVWKSMQLLLKKAGQDYQGAHIKMLNNIPLARGLGSSAAAIVSGLMAANIAIGNVFDKQAILQMATEIEGHPDNVAPAIFGGITLSIMKEKQAETLSFMPGADLKLVVAIPSFNLSTKAARKVLPVNIPMKDAVFNISRTALLVGALCKGDLSHLQSALDDKIHQPYREQLIPGMQDVFQGAIKNGALGAVLSGAGPCLIAFTTDHVSEIGEAMVAAFKKHNISSKYLELKIDQQGVKTI